MEYLEILKQVCDQLQPRTILEFGSGDSTKLFARYGEVTAVEYDPPGDWCGVSGTPGVTLRLIPQEQTPLFPGNLMQLFFETVLGTRLSPGEDPLSQATWMKGRQPKWDLAYIDGAVHVRGFMMHPMKPGWVGGDLSFATRMALVGLCWSSCTHLLIDDIQHMPALANSKSGKIADRLFLISH